MLSQGAADFSPRDTVGQTPKQRFQSLFLLSQLFQAESPLPACLQAVFLPPGASLQKLPQNFFALFIRSVLC